MNRREKQPHTSWLQIIHVYFIRVQVIIPSQYRKYLQTFVQRVKKFLKSVVTCVTMLSSYFCFLTSFISLFSRFLICTGKRQCLICYGISFVEIDKLICYFIEMQIIYQRNGLSLSERYEFLFFMYYLSLLFISINYFTSIGIKETFHLMVFSNRMSLSLSDVNQKTPKICAF